ncbi:MAG: hypothetical protein GF317_05630 [Candidatus Lokiarchaeota archaeon]|nr:hypothetical protein [Candidatus Lokiarchaeota archaeon]MBD3199288.1 hypothetical protein [Candidatus Lokiarchaeota archaeon]
MAIDKVIPYVINLGDVIPARSKATLINELAMALIELINIYGKSLPKLGKVHRITACFWPVRLIPLNETRACVCSYLLNSQEKLSVGDFKQIPAKPENVIKGADPQSFLESLKNYHSTYLSTGGFLSSSNFKRATVIQEALFSSAEVGYFKNFFLNQYRISSFSNPYFLLDGDPIAKSVNQIKIVKDVYDFVSLKDVNMLDKYGEEIVALCDSWINKGTSKAKEFRETKIDTSEEEKQLALLNEELREEKEKDLHATPEELVKSGKYKINDKTGELYNNINSVKNSVDRLKEAINKRDLFLLDEGVKDLKLKYTALGDSIKRYENEIAQLKSNINREISDIEKNHQKKISELERKISEVEKKIEEKHSDLSDKTLSAEEIVGEIKQEKQAILQTIEEIKDQELTNVQEFLNTYTIEIKTKDVVVGIPMFIFYFSDKNTKKTNKRVPVLPILVDGKKIISTKVKESFRSKLEDLMNKYSPVINLVESEGDKSNLMDDIKNIDTRLEEAINDLRVRKILKKKAAAKAKDIIVNLIW